MNHLTLDDRKTIECQLSANQKIAKIARYINKDESTIKREITIHKTFTEASKYNRTNDYEKCIHLSECKYCAKKCKRYEMVKCKIRDKCPGVCNGCPKKQYCRHHKYFYDSKIAHEEYEALLVSSRIGANLRHKNVEDTKKIISELILKNQTPYQIIANHPEFNLSSRTIYYWVQKLELKKYGVIPLVLKESTKRMIVSKEYLYPKKDSGHYKDHEYSDYLQEIDNNDYGVKYEIDTIYNSLSGPYIFTIQIVECRFMFGFIIGSKTTEEIGQKLDYLEDLLGLKTFMAILQIGLADRGTEFFNISRIELNRYGLRRTKIFYTDPMRSCQKPHVENNHNFVRDVIPNGRDISKFTQDDINLIFSHINSMPRKSINGKTPYDLFEAMFGKDVLEKLQIKRIEKDQVTLKPGLIEK